MPQSIAPWRRIALTFPGQGSHSVGMGERLCHASRAAREVFRRADEVLDRKLSRLCFEGPEEELERTVNQQPATFVTSIAWLEALRERWAGLDRKLQPHVLAGHSLGEFTAAVAAGAHSFEEGLLLVRERGRAMDEAGRENPGGMASILGLSDEHVSAICDEASGALDPLKRAMEAAHTAGARKVVRLPITIASHSPLMLRASERMSGWLDRLPPRDPLAPVVGNVHASVLRSRPELHAELRDQLTEGVRWQQAVHRMQELGADLFVEVGPGNVLTKLARRIDPRANAVSLSDERTGLLSDQFAAVESAAR